MFALRNFTVDDDKEIFNEKYEVFDNSHSDSLESIAKNKSILRNVSVNISRRLKCGK